MKVNGKGQVTIPADLRRSHGFLEGDEVDIVAEGNTLRIVRVSPASTPGERVIQKMRGRLAGGMSTDEIMALLRDE